MDLRKDKCKQSVDPLVATGPQLLLDEKSIIKNKDLLLYGKLAQRITHV